MKTLHSPTSALLLAMLLAEVGCQRPVAIPTGSGLPQTERASVEQPVAAPGKTAANEVEPAVTFPEPPADDLSGGQLVEEYWDAYSMQGVRVGYAHTTVVKLSEAGRDLIRTRNFMYLALARGGQTATQHITATSWDTADGKLVRFETQMTAGPGEVVTVGAVEGSQLKIQVTTLGRTETQQI